MPHTALAIKTRAKAIFAERYHYPAVPFRSIGRPCFVWAMKAAAFELEHGTPAERAEREAQQIAKSFEFNINRLQVEVDRRSFGSFTTTLDGSRERRAIYARALTLAHEARDNAARAALAAFAEAAA